MSQSSKSPVHVPLCPGTARTKHEMTRNVRMAATDPQTLSAKPCVTTLGHMPMKSCLTVAQRPMARAGGLISPSLFPPLQTRVRR